MWKWWDGIQAIFISIFYFTKGLLYNIYTVIPIKFTSPGGDFSNTKNDMWMSNTEKSKEIVNMPDDSTPVIFNIQETGYYR